MELLEAIKTIREHCEKTHECSKCVLRDRDDDCYINMTVPSEWELANVDVPPRLFV